MPEPRRGDSRQADGTPTLLYAGSCPKCRWLSQLVVWASLATIRRIPLERDVAHAFYGQDHPRAGGEPVLFDGDRTLYGARVFAAVPWLVLRIWLRRLRAALGDAGSHPARPQ